MVRSQNGPVAQYLKVMGQDASWFEGQLKSGDPAATSVFAMEAAVDALRGIEIVLESLALEAEYD